MTDSVTSPHDPAKPPEEATSIPGRPTSLKRRNCRSPWSQTLPAAPATDLRPRITC